MILSKVFAAHGLRTNRRRTFCPESLEGRNLLSTFVAGPPAHVHLSPHSVPMKGSGEGMISLAEIYQGIPHVTYTGSGQISSLDGVTNDGVTIAGEHTTLPIKDSKGQLLGDVIPAGTLTITEANGDKLDLSYKGAGSLSPASQPALGLILFDDTLFYRITGGTGRFEGAKGAGVIHAIDQAPSLTQAAQAQLPFAFDLSGVVTTPGTKHEGSGD